MRQRLFGGLLVALILGAGCVDLDRPPLLECSGAACAVSADARGSDDAAAPGRPDAEVRPTPPAAIDARLDPPPSDAAVVDAAVPPTMMGQDMASPLLRDVAPAIDNGPSVPDVAVDARSVDATPVDANDAPASLPDVSPDTTPDGPNTFLDGPPQVIGSVCSQGSQCQGGLCVDGVCCTTTCALCFACNLPGSLGTCAPRALGTVCGESRCAAASLTPAPTCDGAGACRPGLPTTCAGYTCADAQVCRVSCTSKSDCAGIAVCVGGKCLPPVAQGQDCTQDAQCGTGKCKQGVCCASDCGSLCYACNVAGFKGVCTAVPRGSADVAGRCVDQGAATCGGSGKCDGAGACQNYDFGTVCGAGTCTNGVATTPRTCAGAAMCGAATAVPCVNFPCNGTVCRSSCANDDECVAPSKCLGGVCGGLSAVYFAGTSLDNAMINTTRIDGNVNFIFNGTSPQGTTLGTDNFSIRWTGKLIPRYSETYTIYVDTDDGTRLWLGDLVTPLIEDWKDQAKARYSKTISLQANQPIDLKIEYYQGGGSASIELFWSSPSQGMEIIPTSRLRPP